ncbi:MAG: divalent-cation tolerance protein CutA [Nitrospirae bacterium]|nr:divalent-cation tolerance protein CutA [Nitrospirota bacterium]
MAEFVVVLITAPNEDDAAKMANDLVASRLAACVNIIRNIRSIYRWQGKIEDEGEVLMLVKTKQESFRDLEKRVKEIHPYTVPEIIALPVIEGSADYLQWLSQETTKI